MKILIKNGTVATENWLKKVDVLIQDAKIKAVAQKILPSKDCMVIDAKGKYVLPGLIDAHTHYSLISRGTVTADDFINGSKVAAFGGVTTVIDFADNEKGKTLAQSASDRINAMKSAMGVDFAIHQGVYRVDDDIESQLKQLISLGVKVLKIFTTYRDVGYLIEDKKKLTELFTLAKKYNLLLTAHCEDNSTIESALDNHKGDFLPPSHAELRTDRAEALAIRFLGSISLKTGCPLYIVHTSSALGLREIQSLKAKGALVYTETTPTYIFKEKSLLSRDDGALFVMTPPLRTQKDNLKIQSAIKNGDVDVIATDHCAFTREQKLSRADNCTKAFPGVPGTGEMFASCYTYLTKGAKKLSLPQLVSLMSTNPAKIFGIYPKKGTIEVGSDADIAIFDPSIQYSPSDDIISSSGYTIFDTDTFTGKFCTTILRGNVIMQDGKYNPIKGEFIRENR